MSTYSRCALTTQPWPRTLKMSAAALPHENMNEELCLYSETQEWL